ncbi:MAG: hypothetical protein ACI4UJ_04060 [Candidatus Cryptobacteroides sp.]
MLNLLFSILVCPIFFRNVQGKTEAVPEIEVDTVRTLVVFWNLENFFDWEDGGTGESDKEFSPGGPRHWTSTKFYRKANLIAKTFFWIMARYGRLPDVAGFAEVENKSVVTRLVFNTLLRKYGYSVLHRESLDHRGIDVALIYRRDSLRLMNCGIRRLDSMFTRDILFADFEDLRNGRRTVFIVNHFPSKYGGAETGSRREAASIALKNLCDSVISRNVAGVVVMGDFNDVPSSPAFDTLRTSLTCLADPFEKEGKGTIRFNGKWDMIDMFWTSSAVYGKMTIEEIPFLRVWDNVYPGFKPLRTYSGPRYLGGVSDHCPIVFRME